MQMSDGLKEYLAEHVYEQTRSMLMVAAPAMKPWNALTGNEQAQCAEAMRLWLAGIGSNEVAEEWFNRSGHAPSAIWDQVPGGPEKTIFIMAGLELMNGLLSLAETGLKQQRPSGIKPTRAEDQARQDWSNDE